MKNIFYLILLFLSVSSVKAQTIYSYTSSTTGAANSVSTNLTGSGLTRVNGANAPGSPCGSGFSSTSFSNTTTYSSTLAAINIDLTPAANYGISVTGFSVGIRRSGTGPASVRLAYSTDDGTTWTDKGSDDAPNNAGCGSTATATWNPTVSATGKLKFRIYAFNASGTAGTFQILNLSVNGSVALSGPVISSPTIQNIDSVTARLGASITSDGGTTITGRGIVWSTSANPVVGQPGSHRVDVSGTTGSFDTLVNGLPAGTLIHMRGFVTNSNGAFYTQDVSFYTLSAMPSGPVTNLTATGISNHDIQLTWTPVSNADGYIVLQKMYTPPTSFPVPATRYNEGDVIGDADVVDTILTGNISTTTYGGLLSGTIYQYAVIPYRFNGTNTETYNYYTLPVVPIAFDTTLGVGPSALSDLVGIQYSEAATIPSVINDVLNTDSNGVKVWQLALRDGGSAMNDGDDMPTTVSKMVITKGAMNSVADWQNTIQYAALFDDSTAAKFADAVIYKDSMVFNNILFVASDNNQKTLTLRISLKNTNIEDNDSLQFTIKRNGIITPKPNFSSQVPVLNIQSDSSKNLITVIATRFVITQQPPADLRVNTLMNPVLKVELQDANGNRDLDYHQTVNVYSSVAPLTNPVFDIPDKGTLVFDSVVFSGIAKGNILKIKGAGIDTAYTIPINIYGSAGSDIVSTTNFIYTDSISYLNYQEAFHLTTANSVAVYGFTIRDGGNIANDADTFPTVLSTIAFSTTGNAFIRRAALFSNNNKIAETAVNDSVIRFNGLQVSALDNDSAAIILRVSFNSRYADQQRIAFSIKEAVADTGMGSLFAVVNAGGAFSSQNAGNNVLKYNSIFVTSPLVVNQQTCKGASVKLTAVKPVNAQLNWYAGIADHDVLYTGDTLSINNLNTTVSYFAESDSLGWRSNRVEVRAMITTVSSPVVNNTTICKGNNISLHAASANNINWYKSFLSGDVLFNGLNFTTGNINKDTVFFVQADSAGCKSDRVSVDVNIQKVTVPEVKDTMVCKGNTVSLLLTSANIIRWYNDVNSVNPVYTGVNFLTGGIQHDTVFYIESDSSGCKSERIALNITTQQVSKPVLSGDFTVCSGNKSLIVADAETTRWYDIPSGGVPLFINDSLETGVLNNDVTYYAEAVENNCASERSPVVIKVNATPAIPVINNDSICSGSAKTLTITSSVDLFWYDAPVDGNLLQSGNSYQTPSLTNDVTYYIQAQSNGCYSDRRALQLYVKEKPLIPVATNMTICSGNIARLGASSSQGVTSWFRFLNDTVAVSLGDTFVTPDLYHDMIYYAAADLQGCLSDKKQVKVVVNQTPDTSFNVNNDEQCLFNNQFVFTNNDHSAGLQYAWSFGDSTSFSFANPVKTFNRTGTFKVSLKTVSSKGCSSESFKMVKVNAPAVDFDFTVAGKEVSFTTSLPGVSSYQWYFTTTDSASGPNPVFTFASGGTYVVKLVITDNTGCKNTISKPMHVFETGIYEELSGKYQLTVFPNPFTENVLVNYALTQTSDVTIEVYDLQGKLIQQVHEKKTAGQNQTMINTTDLQPSVYLLKVNIDGTNETIRIVKQ